MNQAAHRAHGLSGELTAPDWPPVTATEIGLLLEQRPDCGSLLEILWHSPRPFSAAALVETTRGRFFIKRQHRRVRDAAALREEHAFARHLHGAGIPVPELIVQADGDGVSTRGDWVYEVHAAMAGNDLHRDALSWEPIESLPQARAAGAMLARLHRAAEGFVAPQRRTHILVARSELLCASDPVAALRAQLPRRPGLADWLEHHPDWPRTLRHALSPWQARSQAQLAAQPPLWTHGDWHVSNLGWSGEAGKARVSAVFDFGLSARNFALFDLATAIERNAIAWLQLDAETARPAIAAALIQGYREHRPLSRADIELLAELLPIVHLDFALSEVEYYHAITGSRANAELAWNDFLQGHPAWFRSAAGEAFLKHMRCA